MHDLSIISNIPTEQKKKTYLEAIIPKSPEKRSASLIPSSSKSFSVSGDPPSTARCTAVA